MGYELSKVSIFCKLTSIYFLEIPLGSPKTLRTSFLGSFPNSDLNLDGKIGKSSKISAFSTYFESLVELLGFFAPTYMLPAVLGLLSYCATICLLVIIAYY